MITATDEPFIAYFVPSIGSCVTKYYKTEEAREFDIKQLLFDYAIKGYTEVHVFLGELTEYRMMHMDWTASEVEHKTEKDAAVSV